MESINNMIKSEHMQLALAAIFVAVAGEFNIIPFNGESFRIGLGSSAFLIFLLLMRHQSYFKVGLAVSLTVLIFRTIIDMVLNVDSYIAASLRIHASAMMYYLVYALGMSRLRDSLDRLNPFILGLLVAIVDFASNEAELLTRTVISRAPFNFFEQGMLIAVIAFLRCYFIIGLYSSFRVNQMRILQAEQQKRMDQMLTIGSGLFGEAFYLKKSMDIIEKITAKSYDLYSKLNEAGQTVLSRSVLEITQQIHEVKKDSQRILAGLSKLSDQDVATEMSLKEIAEFVLKSNGEYSKMLKIDAEFQLDLRTDFVTSHYIPLLTVLNNLIANAVEAIGKHGTIRLRVYELRGETHFVVSDTGSGISKADMDLVFEPGFTTKFNQDGIAATGIGLSHVRDIVQSFGGIIRILDSPPGGDTTFVATFPTDVLKKEG